MAASNLPGPPLTPRPGRRAWLQAAFVFGVASLMSSPTAETPGGPNPTPAPRRIVVPKLRGSVKIDGELDEAVWAKAALLQPLTRNDGAGPERERTEVRLWYDDEALYLGWTCYDIDIQATLTNRDSPLYQEEVVEFFVAPRDPTHYFEFEWNPLGTVFDAIIDNRLDSRGVSIAVRGDSSYTAKGMKSAVKVKGTINDSSDKDEYWQLEVRLPFADLNRQTPRPKEEWRANFYRKNRTKGLPTELTSWSPTLRPSFHQPARFGCLEFGE
jgi:hypothetical protein